MVSFGLTIAPAVFQGLINDILRDFLNSSVFVYLVDILNFPQDLEEHQCYVRQVLQRLFENNLFITAENREFHTTSTMFLGFITGPFGIQIEPAKLQAVTNWPMLTSRQKLQRFLGFANFYHRFNQGYNSIATPLTALTFLELKKLFTLILNSFCSYSHHARSITSVCHGS